MNSIHKSVMKELIPTLLEFLIIVRPFQININQRKIAAHREPLTFPGSKKAVVLSKAVYNHLRI